MPFVKGRAKTGGRKKGSAVIKKLLRVDQIFANRNIHPVSEILKLIDELEPKDQVKTWLELLRFVQAIPRTLPELEDGGENRQPLLDLAKLPTEELERLASVSFIAPPPVTP